MGQNKCFSPVDACLRALLSGLRGGPVARPAASGTPWARVTFRLAWEPSASREAVRAIFGDSGATRTGAPPFFPIPGPIFAFDVGTGTSSTLPSGPTNQTLGDRHGDDGAPHWRMRVGSPALSDVSPRVLFNESGERIVVALFGKFLHSRLLKRQ